MIRNWLMLSAAWLGAVAPSLALQFTNFTSTGLSAPAASAYDANSTFVSVASDGKVLSAPFVANNPYNPAAWARTNVPGSSSLQAVTFGNGTFAAAGADANVFLSGNGGASWTQTADAFSSPVSVFGLAFNPSTVTGARFVAAAGTFAASYTTNSPPTNWLAATISSPVIFESYRDVVSLGSNRFALCGVLGTVRVSADGGQTWTASRPLNVSAPNLVGIAWNGVQTLVSVGDLGTIVYNTNNAAGGSSWSTAASGTTANLTAVTHTGNEFIAVGANGTVLTSPNGITWSTNSISAATTTTLRDVSAAGPNGIMANVVFIVGDNGTVVLGGDRPPAPMSPVNATNCAQSLPNPPLVVSPVVSAGFPSGTVTADWYAAPTGGSPVASGTGTLSFSPPDQMPAGPNTPSNYVYYAEARDLRTGFVSTNRIPVTLTINPRPTAVVSGNNTICNGQSTTIQAALTGLAPWTLTWSDGFVQTTNASPATRVVSPANPLANHASPATRVVSPANPLANLATNYVFTVTAVSNATSCVNNQPGDLTGSAQITVNPLPTAVVSGDTNIVTGQSAMIEATLTGLAPWTVTWSDGVISSNVLSSPLQRTVNPLTTTTYTVTNLVAASCDAVGGGLTGSATVTVSSATLSITPEGTNVVIEWFGSLTLESATNLSAPVAWTAVTNGAAGQTNRWTNSVIPPPEHQFFRLSATNAP